MDWGKRKNSSSMAKSGGVYIRRRAELVGTVRENGVTDERVLAAIGQVKREQFIEPALRHRAYEDLALPIGMRQTISQPTTVAFQTMLLDTEPGDKVLEIGTGSGYQAAVLCEMGVRVYSVERHRRLHERAKSALNKLDYRVLLRVGDGTQGWPGIAPFDGIVVTAGALEIPQRLLEQLREPNEQKRGGRLVVPVGDKNRQLMTKVVRTGKDSYESSRRGDFLFVPLVSSK